MKKLFKKASAILITIVIVLSFIPLTALAADQVSVAWTPTDWMHGSTGTLRDGIGYLGDAGFSILSDASTGDLIWCIEPGVIVGVSTPKNINNYLTFLSTAHIPVGRVQNVIGKIFQYVPDYLDPWTDAGNRATYIAAQLLIWEVVVGERDEAFNWYDPYAAGFSRVMDCLNGDTSGPANLIRGEYNRIVYGIQNHTNIPSFTADDTTFYANKLPYTYALSGSSPLTISLNDTHGVLGNFNFSATGFSFSVSGNRLTITKTTAGSGTFDITVTSKVPKKSGVITYGDGRGGNQDVCGRVDDPVRAYFACRVDQGRARIVKSITNETDWSILFGFEFVISNSGGTTVGTYTTNASGIINASLDPGTYTVTETANGNFVIDSQNPQTVTVSAGQTATVNFSNTRKMTRLTLQKENADPDKADYSLVGATYEVRTQGYVEKGDGTSWPPNAVVGTLEFTEELIRDGEHPYLVLPLGRYIVKEIVAPKGYTLDPTEYQVNLWTGVSNSDTEFEQLDGGKIVHTKLNVKEDVVVGRVTIIKSFELSDPKPDVEFQMTCVSAYSETDDMSRFDGIYITDENGKLMVEGLPLGTYRFEELRCEANEGYILSEPFEVEIIDEAFYELNPEEERAAVLIYGEDITVNVDNKYMRGKVRVVKLDDYDDTPVSGAEIQIKNGDGEVVATGITDENGVIEFDNLIYGKYYVSEVNAPKNFLLSNEVVEVEITEDGQVIELEYYNTMKLGLLRLFGVTDKYGSENINTGEGAGIFILAGALLLSAAGIIILIRKKKVRAALTSLIALCLIVTLGASMGAPSAFAASQGEITREYSAEESVADIIEDDGQTYYLSGTPAATTNPEPYSVATSKTVEYKLETSRPDIPQTMVVSSLGDDGQAYSGTLLLLSVEQSAVYTVPVTATLRVIEYNLHKYAFGDKIVEFDKNNPDISELHEDILKELDFRPDIYSVAGARWDGDSYDGNENGDYVQLRDMIISLDKRVSDYTAYYSGTVAAGMKEVPINVATYTLPPEDTTVDVPVASPVEETGLTMAQKVMIAAAAIVVFGLIVALVLFMIAKRKKRADSGNGNI